MFVRPRDGFKIRDPYKKDLIPDEGREVPDQDMYWNARLNDGDVVRVPAPDQSTDNASES